MNTFVKVILGILLLFLLVAIGGLAVRSFFGIAWWLLRLVIGLVVVLFVIWLISRMSRGNTEE